MNNGSWRDVACPIISKVVAEAQSDGCDIKELKRRLRDAYPFSERKYWPYKVWCSEVRRQTKKFGKPEPPPLGQTSFLMDA